VSEFSQSNPVTQLFWQHVWNVQGTMFHSGTTKIPRTWTPGFSNYGCSGGVPLPRFQWQRSDRLAQHGHEPGQSGSRGSGGVVNLDKLEAYEETPKNGGVMGYQQTTRPQVRIGYYMYIHTTYTVIVMYICHIDIGDVCLQERVKKLIRLYAGVAMPLPSGDPSWQWDIHGNSVEVEVFDGKIRELKITIFGKLCPCLLVIPPSTTSPFIIMTGHSLAPLFSLVGSFKSPGNSMLAKSKSPESYYILLHFIGYTPFVCSSFF
jgi:hypothetical protein